MKLLTSLDASLSLYQRMKLAAAHTNMDEDDAKMLEHSAYVISQWRTNKQVFRIERILYNDLIETEDADIPINALHLPYQCFYVEISDGKLDGNIDGCFVLHDVLTDGDGTERAFFSFVFLYWDGQKLNFSNTFITSRYYHVGETVRQVYGEHFAGCVISKQTFQRVFLILTYLSAENRDVVEDEIQKHRYHPGTVVKDAVREVRKWDVGIRYVHTKLHDAKHDNFEDTERPCHAQHTMRRPHVRRAHWHLYWTGKGRKIPKIRWVAPCLVNAYKADDLPVVVHV